MRKGRTVLLVVATLVLVGSVLALARFGGGAGWAGATAATQSTPALEARKQQILAQQDDASPEARRRRSHSEAILKSEGVPVAKALPVIWTEANCRLRDQREIAFRALALLAVALKATGAEQANVENFIGNYELDEHFTPLEMAFLQNPAPSGAELAQFSWRYEAAWPMLWALGFVDKLDRPSASVDPDAIMALLKDRDLDQFLAQARLRPVALNLDNIEHYGAVPLGLQDLAAAAFALLHRIEEAIGDMASDHGLLLTTGVGLRDASQRIEGNLETFFERDCGVEWPAIRWERRPDAC